MLDLFTVGIKEDGALSIEINQGLLKVANEEDLINVVDELDMKIIHNLVCKIVECIGLDIGGE